MEFLEWLEMSAVGNWVAGSLWGYPISLGAHAAGMAILAGVALMFSLRVLGVASSVPVNTLPNYMKIAQIGFVINLLSGLALFCGSAVTQWGSWPFRIKIILIFVGLWLTTYIYNNCLSKTGTMSSAWKVIVSLSLAGWVSTVLVAINLGLFNIVTLPFLVITLWLSGYAVLSRSYGDDKIAGAHKVIATAALLAWLGALLAGRLIAYVDLGY